MAAPGPAAADPDRAIAIECVGLEKSFGRRHVLAGVDCRIPRRRITVIMGASGAGKSVLLRHFVGLLRPDRGEVIVDGRSVERLSEDELLALRRDMGMLFKDGALFGSMSLYDNVAFPLRQHTRWSERDVRDIVLARLSEVGLGGAERRMPHELSAAMRRRAGFARALVLEPRILLCDEPDSGLDPVRSAQLWELIREVQRRYGSTAVVIPRDATAVPEVADHVIVLDAGRVVEPGTRAEIRASSHPFTRQLLGGPPRGPLAVD
jgi:phospholipid/cholesterol/gamma-HCH transport system ATP-binding protein